MDISIGLPSAVRATTGTQLVQWATRAEERHFVSLAAIDRLAYFNYEPLTALTAAAAVTERIGLITTVLLGPLRATPTEFAKQALSLHALSGDRLTLGIGLGAREDDFELAGLPFAKRGAALNAILDQLVEAWASEQMGPKTATRPELLFGGGCDATYIRAARYGVGWIAGGSDGTVQFGLKAQKVQAQFAAAGRGEPVLKALIYFSLGKQGEASALNYMSDYYAWLGKDAVDRSTGSVAKDVDTIRRYMAGFEEAGCGELICLPCCNDLAQVDLLADAAGL